MDTKLKRIIKRIIIVIMLVQLTFALLLYTPFFLINNLQSIEGSERVEQNFNNQEELFDSPIGWALFGAWNIAVLYSINWFKDHNEWRNLHYGDGTMHSSAGPGLMNEKGELTC